MLPTLALAALALFQGVTPPAKPSPDRVVATVDGKPLLASEVEPYLWAWRAKEVVREIADAHAVAAGAAKQGVTVTDEELKARLDQQVETIRKSLPAGQTVETFLASKGADMSRLALSLRSVMLVDKIAEREFKPEGFFKADTLLFRTAGDTTDGLKGAIGAADQAYAKLTAGTAWDAVVKASTAGPNSTAATAPMGWKAAELYPESVRGQFATLKPMGYTKPTQTPYGIQIFRLNARGKDAPAAEIAELKRQYVEGSRGAILQRLRTAAPVEIK